MGSALISTLCSIRNASKPGSTKAGNIVVKSVTFLDSPLDALFVLFVGGGGGLTGDENLPVIVSPWV